MNNYLATNKENIDHWREQYAEKSDAELIAISESGHKTTALGAAALAILQERREKLQADRHVQLLTEIRKPQSPHWTTVPMFWVTLVAMLAAIIAAIPVVASLFH